LGSIHNGYEIDEKKEGDTTEPNRNGIMFFPIKKYGCEENGLSHQIIDKEDRIVVFGEIDDQKNEGN
jgi:hypothetical protein